MLVLLVVFWVYIVVVFVDTEDVTVVGTVIVGYGIHRIATIRIYIRIQCTGTGHESREGIVHIHVITIWYGL